MRGGNHIRSALSPEGFFSSLLVASDSVAAHMAKQLYAACLTGDADVNMGLFLIGDGLIVSPDMGGLKDDGTLAMVADGSLRGANLGYFRHRKGCKWQR